MRLKYWLKCWLKEEVLILKRCIPNLCIVTILISQTYYLFKILMPPEPAYQLASFVGIPAAAWVVLNDNTLTPQPQPVNLTTAQPDCFTTLNHS